MTRYRVVLRLPDREEAFEADADEYLLYSAEDAGIAGIPRACEQGWCMACAARLVEGEVDHGDAYLYCREDAEAGFVLLCSAKPRSDLVIEHDPYRSRREMVQHRIERGLPAKIYPKPHFRRGRAKKAEPAG